MAVTQIGDISPSGIKQLLWVNRNNMARVASNMKRALNGAPHVNNTPITSGQSLLLGTKAGGMGKGDFQQIKSHSETELSPFVLSVDGQEINVIWDHTQGPAVTGDDLFDDVNGDDLLSNVSLKLLTV